LRRQIAEAQRKATLEGQQAQAASQAAETARERQTAARELLTIEQFSEIDPHRWSQDIIRLRNEQQRLESSSNQLRASQERLREVDDAITKGDQEKSRLDGEVRSLHDRIADSVSRAQARERQIASFSEYDHDATKESFAAISGIPAVTLDTPDQVASTARQSIQGRINTEQGKVNAAIESMAAEMSGFLEQFPEFRQTLSVGRAYAESFAAALRRVEDEDLPRYRERFEHYLNENLVGDLLMLNRRLEEHQEAIEGRIEEINQALRAIDYGDDSYVQLRLVNRPGPDVAAFRRALRECFEHGIAPAPEERLVIFQRVRQLLEEFQRDPDRTQRVMDVRTWFSAGVQELRRADDLEVNYYAATTGKSGGQKAKLAFTILASALSAQYGLSTAPADSPNFRLVVIDEAFSRTDEANSTRAMQLFARLGFQLLIVGPFDAKAKLAVPFVQTIHLASNPAGNSSQLLALTRDQVDAQPARECPAEDGALNPVSG
jgi:uncharacterized protein YPO0396